MDYQKFLFRVTAVLIGISAYDLGKMIVRKFSTKDEEEDSEE